MIEIRGATDRRHYKWTSGVYEIRNIVNQKKYVGSSGIGVGKRLMDHLSGLRRGVYANQYLQREHALRSNERKSSTIR